MKMSKKVLAIILAMIMVFTLAACGDKEKPAEESSVEESSVEESSVEESSEKPATATLTGKINVYTRDSSSGTRGAFEELVEFKDQLTAEAAEVASNGDMATKVGGDPSGIGYVSLTTDFEGNNLKAVKFEGTEATEATVLDGSYTLKRPFSFVTRAAGDYPSDEVEQLVDAFIVFLTQSTEGLEAVASAGGIVDIAQGKPWEELKKDHPIVDQDNSGLQIRTGGSTSVEKTLKAAADAFQPLAGNVEFVMDQTGSGDGFKRTLGEDKDGANAADIGFASRDFKAEETVDQGKVSGVYCQDAVVVAVQKDNPIESLTKEQVFNIFTGNVANWEELN